MLDDSVPGAELGTELLSLDEEDVVTGLPGVLDEPGTEEDSTGVEDGVGELGTTELEGAQVVTGLLWELLGVEEVRTGLVTVDGGTISEIDVTITVVLGTVEVSTGLLEYGVEDDAGGDDDGALLDVRTGLVGVGETISEVEVTISVELGTVVVTIAGLDEDDTGPLLGADDEAGAEDGALEGAELAGDDDVMTGLLSVAGTDEEDTTWVGGRVV